MLTNTKDTDRVVRNLFLLLEDVKIFDCTVSELGQLMPSSSFNVHTSRVPDFSICATSKTCITTITSCLGKGTLKILWRPLEWSGPPECSSMTRTWSVGESLLLDLPRLRPWKRADNQGWLKEVDLIAKTRRADTLIQCGWHRGGWRFRLHLQLELSPLRPRNDALVQRC